MTDISVNVPTIGVTVEMLTPDVTVEMVQLPNVEVASPVGPPGPVGPQGPPGFSNAVYTGEWRWTNQTDDASNTGQIGNNVAAGWTATLLNINQQKDDSTDVTAHFSHINAGDEIRVQQKTDGTRWVLYEVTGDGVDMGTWWQFPVVTLDHGAQPPNNNTQVIVTHGKLNTDFVSRDGDTMSGPLVLAADPVQPMEAATRSYVDALAERVRQLEEG